MFPLPIISNTNINPVLGMTYSQFLDHRTAMVGSGAAVNSTPSNSCYSVAPSTPTNVFFNYQELTVVPPYGNMMWGTSYGSWFTWDSAFGRLAQHCIPTEFYSNHRDNNLLVMLRYTAVQIKPPFISLNKNGYQSLSYISQNGNTLSKFVYLDTNTGFMMEFNPEVLSVPQLYIP